jgi:multiple sugar transport system ATP-binding protein
MTVRRNLAFPLRVARLRRGEIDARVGETARLLGIEALLERRPAELSGGQRQRVALGRALVRRPKLCLLDEPLSNLDAALRAQLRAELKQLHAELGATFLYVTHDQAEAMTLADRVVVLRAGLVQQVAPPREVYERPKSTFVAEFLGAPRCNIVRPETLSVPEGALAPARGSEVLVGLRPEKLAVHAEPAATATLSGRVYVVELTGAETWVTVELGGQRVTGRAAADYRGRAGETAWVRYDERDLMLFHRENGQALSQQVS